MSIISSIVGPIVSPVVTGLVGGGGFDSLAFHALDDVNGVYSNDVIVGTGVLAEGRTSTVYLPDDTATPIWQPYATGVPGKVYALGKWWYYEAPALTNLQVRSSNLANAEWTATNMTVTYDQTGMRNDANGASLLVATAANATVIANVITVASADQTTRWFLKRSIGTGPVEITVDNGTTWQDVTTETDLTTGFNEAIESLAATTNIQIGIRVVTSGDAVIVGNSGAYTAKKASQVRRSSPIFTIAATGSVNASNPSFDIANHDDTQGAWFVEILPYKSAAELTNDDQALLHLRAFGNSANGIFTTRPGAISTNIGSNDDAFNRSPIAYSLVSGTPLKAALAYGSGKQKINVNGTYGTEANYSGAFFQTAGQPIRLDFDGNSWSQNGGVCLYRNIRRLKSGYVPVQTEIDKLMI